jgi:hypothetical protein
VKVCGYCGRENDEASNHCRECGTEFPVLIPSQIPEAEKLPLPSSILVNLGQIDGAFDFREGFSRPDWKLIRQTLSEMFDSGESQEAWDEVVMQWLGKLQGELGGDYRLRRSRHFAFLSPLDKDASRRLLDFAEGAILTIRDSLGEVAWGNYNGLHVVIVFAEEDDYYQYIADFYRDGTHPKSAGIHIHAGYPHIALIFDTELRAGETIAHELAHHCLHHLSIPLWLNEGVAVVLQKAVGGYSPPSYMGEASSVWGTMSGWTPPVVWDELAEKHHQFWNEEEIQHFWAGTSFHEPGDAVQLSYSLAEVLMHLLAKNREGFLAFVRSARRDDAGQTAALDCLGTCLGEAAGTFLGEGNWRPQRKAIKACWEAERANQPGQK